MDGHNPHIPQAIAELRLHNSTSSAILRLPNELSIIIFSFCVAAGESYALTALLTLSSVCFDWRELTIHTPSLWADALHYVGEDESDGLTFPNIDASAMDIIASRAQPLPIYISFHPSTKLCVFSLLDNLRKHLHHLGELRIMMLQPDALGQLTAPAPLLQSFTAQSDRSHEELPILDPDLFARSAPNLKNLMLQNPRLLWNAVPRAFAHVRNLDLRNSATAPEQDMTVARLLIVLSTMPQLEELSLDGCPVFSASDAHLTLPRVDLQYLRSMRWEFIDEFVDCRICTPLMRSLSLPNLKGISIHLVLDLHKQKASILRSICADLLRYYTQTPLFSHPLSDLTISQLKNDYDDSICVVAKPQSDGDGGRWRGLEIVVQFVGVGDCTYDLCTALAEICNALPFDRVKRLTVAMTGSNLLPDLDSEDYHVIRTWQRACSGMRGLESVEVDMNGFSTQDARYVARIEALRSAIQDIVGIHPSLNTSHLS